MEKDLTKQCCGSCKYWYKNDKNANGKNCYWKNNEVPSKDDFCSKWEKNEKRKSLSELELFYISYLNYSVRHLKFSYDAPNHDFSNEYDVERFFGTNMESKIKYSTLNACLKWAEKNEFIGNLCNSKARAYVGKIRYFYNLFFQRH